MCVRHSKKEIRLLKDVVELVPKFWRELGGKIAKWVREDFVSGKYQNDMQRDRYRSRQYMEYKANDMRRKTAGGKGKSWKEFVGERMGPYMKRHGGHGAAIRAIAGEWKEYKKSGVDTSSGSGQRLKAYYGRSIASREIGFVNMILTGDLMKGLKPKKWDNYSVTMGFNSVDAGKILGGQKYDREVMGLNTENRDLVKQEIIKEFDRNQIEWRKEPINIYIKY